MNNMFSVLLAKYILYFSGNRKNTNGALINPIFLLHVALNTLSVSDLEITPSFSHCKLLLTETYPE